jgi:hypothetical protein
MVVIQIVDITASNCDKPTLRVDEKVVNAPCVLGFIGIIIAPDLR